MSRRILLEPATRIEGSADLHIEIEEGRVTAARFQVQDFRGFERFMQGRRIETAPHTVSRICGLCSASHQVAGYQAIEDALGVEVPPAARALRQAALMGEWIASHAVSYFFLTAPDFLEGEAGLFDLMKSHPEMAVQALALRRAGQEIVQAIGGRSVHPVSFAIGGFIRPPEPEDLATARTAADTALDLARNLVERAGDLPTRDEKIAVPPDQRVNLLAFDQSRDGDGDGGRDGVFRVFDPGGAQTAEFARKDFEDHVAEMRADWSFAKFPYIASAGFPDGIVLVGPVARRRLQDGPAADPEVAAVGAEGGTAVDAVFDLLDYDRCRLAEILWAAKEAVSLLDQAEGDFDRPQFDARKSGRGVGVVEAPRGVLVHNYQLEEGCISQMRLLVATQFNNAFLNLLLKDVAQAHVVDGDLSEEGNRMLGRTVRIFDPCLSCATH